MGEFRMPSLGADMEAGKVVEWLVKPGDTVHRGDIVAVVDTDKADIDVEIFEDGVVDELLVPVGEKVPVGTLLATLRAVDARAPLPAPESPTHEPPPHEPAEREPAEPAAPVAWEPEADLHSPLLRRLAHHLGVDLQHVLGTGPDGQITRADIETAAAGTAAPEARPTAASDRAQAMRDAIGRLMARSKREIPHYYLRADIDFSAARSFLDAANATRPMSERVLPAALLVKAVALAARDVPGLNGSWLDDHFEPAKSVHVGVAISLREGGLVAPAIHDADAKGVDQLMVELRDLVQRTRGGHLRSSEMSAPTITVTNLGDQGVDEVQGVIYPPQVAIVGFGRIAERPWAQNGMVGVRSIVTATLAGDHRASDGHQGARFLSAVDRHLQDPQSL